MVGCQVDSFSASGAPSSGRVEVRRGEGRCVCKKQLTGEATDAQIWPLLPFYKLGNLRLRGQYLRIDRIRHPAQDCLTEIPYPNHHSLRGELFGKHRARATHQAYCLHKALAVLPSSRSGSRTKWAIPQEGDRGTWGLAVAEDQFFASIIAAVFGPETQETVDNLHHLLLQSWVLYLIFGRLCHL